MGSAEVGDRLVVVKVVVVVMVRRGSGGDGSLGSEVWGMIFD